MSITKETKIHEPANLEQIYEYLMQYPGEVRNLGVKLDYHYGHGYVIYVQLGEQPIELVIHRDLLIQLGGRPMEEADLKEHVRNVLDRVQREKAAGVQREKAVEEITDRRGPVLQPWVCNLTFMQQSVLITACRGPDSLSKNHISKQLCRWMRRCFLYSAFEKKVFTTPYQRGGGSFTGPCVATDDRGKICIDAALDQYLKSVDEVPHHFHLHLMHAAEILGYKHPYWPHRKWWNKVYVRIVKDAHLNPETEEQMDKRLGDCHEDWIAAEEVTAD